MWLHWTVYSAVPPSPHGTIGIMLFGGGGGDGAGLQNPHPLKSPCGVHHPFAQNVFGPPASPLGPPQGPPSGMFEQKLSYVPTVVNVPSVPQQFVSPDCV